MENQELKPENIGVFNIATLATIAAKQNAIMKMLAAITEKLYPEGNQQDIFDSYQKIAKIEADLLVSQYSRL